MGHDFDWNSLERAVETKHTSFKFADVEHLFKKVAWDMYKPLSGSDQLWELRDGEDGQRYLFALYEDAEDLTVESNNEQSWKAYSDRDGENVTLSYCDVPMARFASKEYSFKPEEAQVFAEFIVSKASTDESFTNKLIHKLPEAKQQVLAKLMSANRQDTEDNFQSIWE